MVDLNTWRSGWEIIAEDESKEADQHSSLANLDSSPGTSGHKMGHGPSGKLPRLHGVQIDAVFFEVSYATPYKARSVLSKSTTSFWKVKKHCLFLLWCTNVQLPWKGTNDSWDRLDCRAVISLILWTLTPPLSLSIASALVVWNGNGAHSSIGYSLALRLFLPLYSPEDLLNSDVMWAVCMSGMTNVSLKKGAQCCKLKKNNNLFAAYFVSIPPSVQEHSVSLLCKINSWWMSWVFIVPGLSQRTIYP